MNANREEEEQAPAEEAAPSTAKQYRDKRKVGEISKPFQGSCLGFSGLGYGVKGAYLALAGHFFAKRKKHGFGVLIRCLTKGRCLEGMQEDPEA